MHEPEKADAIVMTVTRRFEMPAEVVFDAWLDPIALGRWLFATPGGVLKHVAAEPRVGGKFVVNEQRGSTLAEHFGTYIEIVRPTRLVFDFATDREQKPTRVTVIIKPLGQSCELTLSHEMDAKWTAFEERARAGWMMILTSLARVLDETRNDPETRSDNPSVVQTRRSVAPE